MAFHIGIAGSGLSGRLTALACLDRGWRVTLFDADDRFGVSSCGWVAAGMLAPFTELESSESFICQLGIDSLMRWPAILASLIGSVSFDKNGTLLVAHPQDSADLQRVIAIIEYKLRTMGFSQAESPMAGIPPNGLSKFINGASPSLQTGYWIRDEGHINTHEFYEASTATLLAKGVHWNEHATVQKIAPNQVVVDNQTYYYDMVFDCRGLGAKADWPTLRGVRGEVILLETTDVTLTCPVRIMHPRYPIYLSPRANNTVIVGATSIESDDKSAISAQSMMELLSACYAVHPGFAEARIVKTMTQSRPTLPDNQPRLQVLDGLIRMNGFYRHGYLIGPAVIQDMMRYVDGGLEAMKYPELVVQNEEVLACKS